jgi:hypothetical protein
MQTEKMVRITVAGGCSIWSSDVTRDPATGVVTKQLRHRYKPGQTLEVEESEVTRLIKSGHAINPVAVPDTGAVQHKDSALFESTSERQKQPSDSEEIDRGIMRCGQRCGERLSDIGQ